MDNTTHDFRPLTEIVERDLLVRLAKEVKPGGLIVEIGTMYGGGTIVLAKANPEAKVISIDNYSWHPPDGEPASKEEIELKLSDLGITNVELVVGNSIDVGKSWTKEIDFIFIDGGHEYETAYSDLVMLGSRANVIAIHDFHNPWLAGVHRAVADFMEIEPGKWKIDEVAHWIAVLRRIE